MGRGVQVYQVGIQCLIEARYTAYIIGFFNHRLYWKFGSEKQD